MAVDDRVYSGKNAREEAGEAIMRTILSLLWEDGQDLKLKRTGHFRGFTLMSSFSGREGETPKLYLPGKHTYGVNLNMENPFGTITSMEYALCRLDKDAEEEKAKYERLEKALADYQEQPGRPFEHQERLREPCLKQQEINKPLDLDKSDVQAAANDGMPREDKTESSFVERLAAERCAPRQVNELESVA